MDNFENDVENKNNLKQEGLEIEETVSQKENEENVKPENKKMTILNFIVLTTDILKRVWLKI